MLVNKKMKSNVNPQLFSKDKYNSTGDPYVEKFKLKQIEDMF